jgi:hypothetical protein
VNVGESLVERSFCGAAPVTDTFWSGGTALWLDGVVLGVDLAVAVEGEDDGTRVFGFPDEDDEARIIAAVGTLATPLESSLDLHCPEFPS